MDILYCDLSRKRRAWHANHFESDAIALAPGRAIPESGAARTKLDRLASQRRARMAGQPAKRDRRSRRRLKNYPGEARAVLARAARDRSAMTLAAVQLDLPLDCAPDRVRAHGLRAAHVYPLVGRRIGPSKTFWSGRVPANRAWNFSHIVLDDAGATWATMTFDCDNRQAMAAGLGDLPPYSWIVRTRRGGHVSWALAVPVGKHQAARAAPEAYLSAVAEYYHHALGADPAFGGLSRNPAHPKADTVWGRRKPYSLDELSAVVPFNWRKPRIAQTGIGRNRDLFMATCRGDRGVSALTMAHALNRDVADAYGREPLPDSEVAGIARSVERYRRKWDRQGHKSTWLARQAARARMQIGRSRKDSASPDGSNEALRPWDAEGISRRTWYRRRAAKRGTVANTGIGGAPGPLALTQLASQFPTDAVMAPRKRPLGVVIAVGSLELHRGERLMRKLILALWMAAFAASASASEAGSDLNCAELQELVVELSPVYIAPTREPLRRDHVPEQNYIWCLGIGFADVENYQHSKAVILSFGVESDGTVCLDFWEKRTEPSFKWKWERTQ